MEVIALILMLTIIFTASFMFYTIIVDILEDHTKTPYMLRLVCDKNNSYTIEVKITKISPWKYYYYIGKCDIVVAMDIFREQLQSAKFTKSGVICKQKIK